MGETEITSSSELQIELKSAGGDFQRVIRVLDPLDNMDRQKVVSALAPALTAAASEGAEPIPFFFDDYDPTKGLVSVGTILRVDIQRSETAY